MKWPDLRRLDGYLPPEMESAYRLHYLKDDTRTASITMLFLSFLLVAFAYNDYLLLGLTPPFYFLITLRSAYLIYFTALIIYLRKNRSPQKFDINLIVWLILSIILVTVINLTRTASYSGNFMLDVILVLLVYLCMPMRLAFRAAGALVFTAFEIVIFFGLHPIASTTLVFSTIVSLAAANVGGIFASGLLYSHRRREYQTRRERETIVDEWQTTFNSIADLISIQDKDYRLVRVNKAYADTFDMKPEELVGKHCYEIVHGTSCPIECCPQSQTMKSKKPVVEEIFEPRMGICLEISTSPILDGNGEVAGTVHLTKDITQRKRLQQKLEELSTHDFLTGLPNRALLNDRLSVAVAHTQRRGEKLALMSLDLDHFKIINDTMGHAAGDEVLKSVAERLQNAIRANDTAARTGGDEFQVLMHDARQTEDIIRVAERILQAFAQPISVDGLQTHTSVSIGIVLCPDEGTDMDTLSKKSDQAMYESKGKGRNCYTFYK